MEFMAGVPTSAAHLELLEALCLEPLYASHYCEENVYHLSVRYCALRETCPGSEGYAVFISNELEQTPIWCQRMSDSPEEPVIWDYHVIFLLESGGAVHVFDLDTTLSCPAALSLYLARSFRPEVELKQPYRQLFRVVPAADFVAHFASDRSHMLASPQSPSTSTSPSQSQSNAYQQPPPAWPCPRGPLALSSMNLPAFVSMLGGPLPHAVTHTRAGADVENANANADAESAEGEDTENKRLGFIHSLEEMLAWAEVPPT
ncbi:N-terminal glutamine amidase-domain-containing protein [Ochromonadaceae sp. CCMP2298]|nr:N-terminal glutamine amidase-domain-containing protein [Ochromonadaceae sp. CCMP2298]